MSDQALSADTEVVLLLCGRFGGERQEPHQTLFTREYGELAKWLKERGLRPADLLAVAGRTHLEAVHEARLDRKRVEFLLGRGTAMALAVERWSRAGLWVISRGDAEFPKRLKHHLKHATPPLLYGAGQKTLLDMGGVAVVGSREASEAALAFTTNLAAKCAQEGIGVVSGGARGVDAAAMQGVADAGGYSMGVLANDLLKASVNRLNRAGLQEGRLVLVSPYFPEAGFNTGNAMGRNKYIYALSDRALVIDSAHGQGGTWEGATEALTQRWVPLYVRMPGEGDGNAALVERGAIAFTFALEQGGSLLDYLKSNEPDESKLGDMAEAQASLLAPAELGHCGEATSEECSMQESHVREFARDTLDMYADFLAKLPPLLKDGPLSDEEVSESLGLEKGQAKAWLKKAVELGQVMKLKKPVRYAVGPQTSLLG